MKLWPWRGRRAAREQELNREIEWHLNEIREEREADGLSPRQAVHAARREFGNVAMVQEDTRAAWGWTLWSSSHKTCATPCGPWAPTACSR